MCVYALLYFGPRRPSTALIAAWWEKKAVSLRPFHIFRCLIRIHTHRRCAAPPSVCIAPEPPTADREQRRTVSLARGSRTRFRALLLTWAGDVAKFLRIFLVRRLKMCMRKFWCRGFARWRGPVSVSNHLDLAFLGPRLENVREKFGWKFWLKILFVWRVLKVLTEFGFSYSGI